MITTLSTQRLAQLTGNLSQTLSEISSLLTDAAAAPADTETQEAAPKTPAKKKASKSLTSSTPEVPNLSTEASSESASEDKKITMIELRDLLNQKSRDGFTDKVKELIMSYGVKKLSQIPEEKYPEVYAAAEKFTKEG